VIVLPIQTGNKRVLFDVAKNGRNVAPKFVPEEDEQEPNESRRRVDQFTHLWNNVLTIVESSYRLWSKLTYAIDLKDMEAATEAKTAVEDAQREMRRKMEERGQKHEPRFFKLHDGRWEPKFMYAWSNCLFECCAHIDWVQHV
jgi:hypothetical protein